MNQIRKVGIEDALQRLAQGRVISPDRENTKAAQKVEIADALPIVQILPLAAAKADIVSNGFEDPNHLLIEMASMHGKTVEFALRKQVSDVVRHLRPLHPLSKSPYMKLDVGDIKGGSAKNATWAVALSSSRHFGRRQSSTQWRTCNLAWQNS